MFWHVHSHRPVPGGASRQLLGLRLWDARGTAAESTVHQVIRGALPGGALGKVKCPRCGAVGEGFLRSGAIFFREIFFSLIEFIRKELKRVSDPLDVA